MNTFNKKAIAGFVFGTMVAGQAFAGSLGATSSDTSLVTLEIADKVQITEVDNIPLGAYSGTGVLSGETEYCVHRNGGDDYNLKLTTDTGSFKVSSATTSEDIDFSVMVDDSATAADGEAMTYNTASGALAGSAEVDCGGNDNGALEVTFAQEDLLAVSSANDYKATITILVTPI